MACMGDHEDRMSRLVCAIVVHSQYSVWVDVVAVLAGVVASLSVLSVR